MSCDQLICHTLFTLCFPGISSLLTRLTAVNSELRPVSFLSLQFVHLARQRKQTCRKLSCVHMISFYHSTRNLRREPGTKATHIHMHKSTGICIAHTSLISLIPRPEWESLICTHKCVV